jgi:predicted ATP-grasp superfamily ATP-dependent carboligase
MGWVGTSGQVLNVRQVAIFDSHLPPGIAFVRSLGAAGVPTTIFSNRRHPAGRYSRYARSFEAAPDPNSSDEFIEWLADQLAAGRIDLVAPTSDAVVFAIAGAVERVSTDAADAALSPARTSPSVGAIHDVLFKPRFAAAMGAAGFPAPECATPTTIEGYRQFADEHGYPVVLKPRSHVAIGQNRGGVVHNRAELEAAATPYLIGEGHTAAMAVDPHLAWPLIQRYLPPDRVEVISVSGCLAGDGRLTAVGHSRKAATWPPGVGVGTQFEWLGQQPFTERAVDAVRQLIGFGLFELEVCYDRVTGEARPIDLNPRGFGQMSLDMAHGNDLPRLWYESLTGETLPGVHRRRLRSRPAGMWRMAIPYYVAQVFEVTHGPRRLRALGSWIRNVSSPSTGAVADIRDPLPAFVYSLMFFRHPGGLLRPLVRWKRRQRQPLR